MKSHQSKIASPKVLSPKLNLYNIPFADILSSLSHHRCLSAKNSPYKNQASIERLKSILKYTSRYHSPKFSAIKKPVTEKKLKKRPKIKINKITHRKKKSSNVGIKKGLEKLQNLEGKKIIYAPKIFKNQIFCDIYDSSGNHDRIMEIEDTSKDFDDVLVKGKLLIPLNIENDEEKTEKRYDLRQPENSYLEETKVPIEIHQDIFKKLSIIASHQKKDYIQNIK